MYYGRKKELTELEYRYNSSKKEFGLIYGRRRIGKSSLIKMFIQNKKALLFQAKKDNAYGNLRSLSYEINKYFQLPTNIIYESYQNALDTIVSLVHDERFIFCIDEYPYIVGQDATFPSIMQEFIDNAPDNFIILLSGSDVSFLKEEILDQHSPLYKRITFEMEIRKLPFEESILFLMDLNNEDKCAYLSLFQSSPYYLSSIDKTKSLKENLLRLVFNEYGTFFNLPDQLLSNSTKVQDVYNAILVAMSHKKTTITEISDYIHEDKAKVAKYLETLLSSEIVSKKETFLGNKKTVYYAVNDTLLLFWYTFIFDHQDEIRVNGEMIYQELEEKIKLFISKKFEDVAIYYMDYLNRKGLLKQVFPILKTYKADKSILNRSIEIDGLSLKNNHLIVMEAKYRSIPFDNKMFMHLKESASIFKEDLIREYYIFSKSGFSKDLLTLQEDNLHLFSLDDLFNIK